MDTFILDKNKTTNDDDLDNGTSVTVQLMMNRIPVKERIILIEKAEEEEQSQNMNEGEQEDPKLKQQQQILQPNTNKSEYAFNTAKDYYYYYYYYYYYRSLKALGLGKRRSIMVSKDDDDANDRVAKLPFHESEEQSGIVVMRLMMLDRSSIPRTCLDVVVPASTSQDVLHLMTMIAKNARRHEVKNMKNTVNNKKCDSIDYLKNYNLKAKLIMKMKKKENSYNNDQITLNDITYKDFMRKQDNNNTTTTTTTTITSNPSTKTAATYIKFDDLVELVRNEKRIMSAAAPGTLRLRLRGGGEGSLTNATTGWGSPPNPAVGGGTAAGSWGGANPPPQWGQAGGANQPNAGARANSQQPGEAQKSSAAAVVAQQQGQSNAGQQQAGGQLPGAPGQVSSAAVGGPQSGSGGQFPPIGGAAVVAGGNGSAAVAAGAGGQSNSSAAKNQLEQLNTMREALFAQDGWGCQNVNQDTNWDVPGSPEPLKSDPSSGIPASWKGEKPVMNMNNGTELWEANLRNGGQQPAQPPPKAQWNPKTPYGGTWGEDEESEPQTQLWGNTNAPPPTPATPGWNQPTPGSTAPVWPSNPQAQGGGPKPGGENEWSGGGGGGGGGGNGVTPWGGNAPSASDPRAMIANRNDSLRGIQGDPKGVSGRLAPPSLEAWNTNMQSGGHMPINNMIGQPTASNGQWPVTGPKDMPSKPTNWAGEGTSPPRPARQGLQSYDDGTSLWQNPQSRIPGNTPWKEMPDNSRGGNLQGRPGGQGPGGVNQSGGQVQSRLGPSGPIKPDGMWGQNRSWDEHNPSWDDKIPGVGAAPGGGGGGGGGGWNDSMNSWNKAKPNPLGQNWNDGLGDGLGGNNDGWAHPSKQNKLNTTEMIRASKPFRTLIELGIKKEDAEFALRTTANNFDDALELLRTGMGGAGDQWRRTDDHPSAFDQHSNVPGRFPGGPQPSLPFPPNNSMGNLPNLGSAIPGANPGGPLNKLPQVPPNYVPPGAGGGGFSGSNNPLTGGSNPGQQPQSSQPSTQQLRMLVQQIQMAVQAGYLNHQILNQPLAPQTLILLNQLLTCIKQLQQLQPNNIRNQGINPVQANIITAKIQQQIKQLQGQITAQQQIYMKQAPSSTPSTNDYLRSPTADPLQTITSAFPELNITGKADPGYNTPSSMSRLETAWKVQKENDSTDFSRAPGTTTKSTLSNSGNSILNLNNDGPWSSNPSGRDGGWPDSGNDADKNDWPSQNSPAFNDLVVPEFKPGEPWKGTQQKSIEDDPSITPGSVARSPLSIAAKDTDIFSGTSKTSPTDIQPLNISSSTWSFSSGQQNFSSFPSKSANANTWSDSSQPLAKAIPSGTSGWADSGPQIPKAIPSSAADLWSASKRGPPPGLGSQKSSSGNGNMSGNWMGLIGNRGSGSNWQSGGGGGGGWSATSSSSWLLLKNLTAQIDGSTLRTLCMQHGPLQNFHLYLNHGIALCKYSSREEASKAQQALNNCVLGNTTICAESPSDGEVQSILQHLGAPSGGGVGGNGGPAGGGGGNGNGNNSMSAGGQSWRPPTQQGPNRATGGSDAWGPSWPTGSSSSNLWTPIDGSTVERGTPSNLNSYLPENLLGGELN